MKYNNKFLCILVQNTKEKLLVAIYTNTWLQSYFFYLSKDKLGSIYYSEGWSACCHVVALGGLLGPCRKKKRTN